MTEPLTPLPPTDPAGSSWAPVRAASGVLGGVCGGLATAAGIDITLVRLAFVAAGLAGFGIVAYVVLWLVLPRESPERPLVPAPPETAKWLGLGMLVAAIVGLVGLVGSFNPWFGPWDGGDPSGKFWLGALLMGIGALVLWSNRRREPGSAPGAPAVFATAAPGSTLPPPSGPPVGTATTRPTGPPPTQPVATPEATPSSGGGAGLLIARVVGWFALLTAVPAVLALVAAQALDVVEVLLPGLVWTLVGASMAGLFVVLVAVRRAWVVATAIVVLAMVSVATAALTRFDGEVAERIEQPASLDELVVPDLAAGRLVLDLTSVDFPEGTTSLPVDMGVGQVEIVLPAEVAVRADVSVGMGEAEVLGTTRSGISVDVVRSDTPTPSSGSVDVQVDLRAGQVRVCRAGPDTGGTDGCGVNR